MSDAIQVYGKQENNACPTIGCIRDHDIKYLLRRQPANTLCHGPADPWRWAAKHDPRKPKPGWWSTATVKNSRNSVLGKDNGIGPLSSLRSADNSRSVTVLRHFAIIQGNNLGLYMRHVAINYPSNHNPMFQNKKHAQQEWCIGAGFAGPLILCVGQTTQKQQ